MNKQETIKLLQEMSKESFEIAKIYAVHIDNIVEVIDQIDEPQKVVVPEFIDSYIRYAKAEGMSLFIAMDNAQNKESEWIITNEKTFARACIDGYEVYIEKLYTVEIPNPKSMATATILEKFIDGNHKTISLVFTHDKDWKNKSRNHLTEEEIKQDFEWAWQFAKEVE
ncbi:TPA: DUF1642 domain-containing protein [Streptococcus suis]